ncbi:hypothetical protein P3L10_032364 [Capsicum annuum]
MELHTFMKKFSYRTERSSGSSYYLVCVVEDCTWFLRSSRINKSNIFKTRKYCDIHTCSIKNQVYARRQGMTKMVAGLILGNYVDTKRIYTPNNIVSDMMREHEISLDYHQEWRAKIKAVKMLRGDPTKSYQKTLGYLYMLEKHYRGSVISWEKIEENRFLYAFVALDVSIHGWKHCRPIIVVDGATLKSLYGGTMLTVSTLDPGGMCIMSDRNESIWKATSTVYPNLSHHACIWHLWCNIKVNFHKNLEELHKKNFAMAKAYTLQQFEKLMGRVDQIDKRVMAYLFQIGYHKWHEEARNTLTELTVKYNDILTNNRLLSQRMIVKASNEFLHTVSNEAKRFIICLQIRKCRCGEFQLDEIPCSHAMATITYRNQYGENYCSPYYNNKNFRDAYAIPVEPLPCESTWKIPREVLDKVVLPPDSKRPPRRPCYER